MLLPIPGDPWGIEQHHWNTGANENQQLNPGGLVWFRTGLANYPFVHVKLKAD